MNGHENVVAWSVYTKSGLWLRMHLVKDIYQTSLAPCLVRDPIVYLDDHDPVSSCLLALPYLSVLRGECRIVASSPCVWQYCNHAPNDRSEDTVAQHVFRVPLLPEPDARLGAVSWPGLS